MKHPGVGPLVPSTRRKAASRFRHTRENARDLSERPIDGTTSGCPPPSRHQNYRRALHKQQRNRWERPGSARFWRGVAQMARRRDSAHIVSHCFLTRFSPFGFYARDRPVARDPGVFAGLASPDRIAPTSRGEQNAPPRLFRRPLTSSFCRFRRECRELNRSPDSTGRRRPPRAPKTRDESLRGTVLHGAAPGAGLRRRESEQCKSPACGSPQRRAYRALPETWPSG